ncbi:bacillithiol biosynthesis deacetylase BshB2 [Priestia koreensis]|uniref:Deacetylase n=1 Tax=Priestia koreensis TaxID=284581 RepID=A0A0M0L5I6_9BACI|nr:bacillithiol biosynthesis deacetylase BshB2 [Priestia koreensis]KOO46345.1 deacetylase [Priestia koreensis]MCM3006450.1 bacillithiol biosynthesis deacetylase BshB2 [Priestia koreensis]UNL83649.1 bacillithiol biosynthesis deacetylase BshB2 [Priestia koreensis]
MEERILVVFPHPDDEAFGAAGTIALAKQRGASVTYACITLGEMGRNMGRPLFANRETLPKIRKHELQEVSKVLQLDELRMLGLRDKTLEFLDEDEFSGKIKAIIDEVKPTLIITHYPGYAVHPDHNATGAATLRAVASMKEEDRPVVWCHAFSRDRIEHIGHPDVRIDVSPVKEIKIEAIKAHRSQTEGMMGNMDLTKIETDPQAARLLKNEEFWTYKFS